MSVDSAEAFRPIIQSSGAVCRSGWTILHYPCSIPILRHGGRRRSAQTEFTRLTECASTIPPFSPFRSIL